MHTICQRTVSRYIHFITPIDSSLESYLSFFFFLFSVFRTDYFASRFTPTCKIAQPDMFCHILYLRCSVYYTHIHAVLYSCDDLVMCRYHSNVVLILVLDRLYMCTLLRASSEVFRSLSACVNFFFFFRLNIKMHRVHASHGRRMYMQHRVKGAKSPSRSLCVFIHSDFDCRVSFYLIVPFATVI